MASNTSSTPVPSVSFGIESIHLPGIVAYFKFRNWVVVVEAFPRMLHLKVGCASVWSDMMINKNKRNKQDYHT